MQIEQFIPYLIVGIIAVSGGAFYITYLAGKKRTEDIQAFASQRGYVFTEKPEIDLTRWKIFSKGHSHWVRNMIKGFGGPVDI